MCSESGLDLAGTDVHGVPSSGGREAQQGQTCALDNGNTGGQEEGAGCFVEGYHPVERGLWPVAERNRMVAGSQPWSMPLPRRLKFRAMPQGEQAPEHGSGSQAEAGPGKGCLLCAAQHSASGGEEGPGRRELRERPQCDPRVPDTRSSAGQGRAQQASHYSRRC